MKKIKKILKWLKENYNADYKKIEEVLINGKN